ncbi:hypothetical protein GHT06_021098 [Daphnia sinensis]|uniref:Uncharacterized protein n=1 Tax=Daphnia sinensis TaxID=1820382 RepID=A0AAD5L8V1_9CRUS|nr:hypothetical protein GHT06_021098 [Daphnia sinensis]
MGVDIFESVSCDLAKLRNKPSFQTWIGFTDVQSSPTNFYVEKNSSFSQLDTPLPYEIVQLNTGSSHEFENGEIHCTSKGNLPFLIFRNCLLSRLNSRARISDESLLEWRRRR